MSEGVARTCYYLALDPGKTTGWASFDKEGNAIRYGQAAKEEVYDLLDAQAAKVLIVEDFELFPWKSKDMPFDTLVAVRVIGALDHWAYKNQAQIVLQKPNIKSIGYMWAGITKPKNHAMSHGPDAYVHGVYYLQKNKIRKPQQGASV